LSQVAMRKGDHVVVAMGAVPRLSVSEPPARLLDNRRNEPEL
jgi:hypothetical protein